MDYRKLSKRERAYIFKKRTYKFNILEAGVINSSLEISQHICKERGYSDLVKKYGKVRSSLLKQGNAIYDREHPNASKKIVVRPEDFIKSK